MLTSLVATEGWSLVGATVVSCAVLAALVADALRPVVGAPSRRRERLLLLHRLSGLVFLLVEVLVRLPAALALSAGTPGECAAHVAARAFAERAQRCCGRVAWLVALGALSYMTALDLQLFAAAAAWVLCVLCSATLDTLIRVEQGAAAAVGKCFAPGAAPDAGCLSALAGGVPPPRPWYFTSACALALLWAGLRWHERRARGRRPSARSSPPQLSQQQPAWEAAPAQPSPQASADAAQPPQQQPAPAPLKEGWEDGGPAADVAAAQPDATPVPRAAATPSTASTVAPGTRRREDAAPRPAPDSAPPLPSADGASSVADALADGVARAPHLRGPAVASSPLAAAHHAHSPARAPAAVAAPQPASLAAVEDAAGPSCHLASMPPLATGVAATQPPHHPTPGQEAVVPLYHPSAITCVWGVKTRGIGGAPAESLGLAHGEGPAADGGGGGGEGAAWDAEALLRAQAERDAYALSAARVREVVEAAYLEAITASGLEVLRCSVNVFPGCIFSVLAAAVLPPPPGAGSGFDAGAGAALPPGFAEALRRGVLVRLTHPTAGGGGVTVEARPSLADDAEELAEAAHAADVHLSPAVVTQRRPALEGGDGAVAVEAALVMPPALRALLDAAGSGVRVVATVPTSPFPLLDLRWAPGAMPPDGRLCVSLPPALLDLAAPLVHISVLAVGCADTPDSERFLTELPLLCLPPVAAAELAAAFDAMCARLGSRAAAYRHHFAPLARDLGALLDPRAGGAAALVAADVTRFLRACGAEHTLALLRRPAPPPSGGVWEGAAAPASAAAAAGAGWGADAAGTTSAAAASPRPAAAVKDTPRGLTKRRAAAPASAPPAAAGEAPDAVKPRAVPSTVTGRHLLCGFPSQAAEDAYAAFKAHERQGMDLAFLALKMFKDLLSAFKLAPLARLPGQLPPIGIVAAILVAGSLPYALLIPRPAAFRARRDALLGLARAACGAMALASFATPPLRAATTAVTGGLYQRPAPGLLWAFLLVPALQQLRVRTQLACSPLHIAHGYAMLWHMHAAAGTLEPWALLAQVCVAEACACLMVAVLDALSRARFLAAHCRRTHPLQPHPSVPAS